MAKILLINPPKEVALLDWGFRYPPLGLISVAAVLDGHDVEILDLKIDQISNKDLSGKMDSADIVGITVLTPSIDSALELCQVAKDCDCRTVLGGVHPSLLPQVVDNPEVDIIVRGEGEFSFKEIADGLPLDTIHGISYKEEGQVRHNPNRSPADLNELPFPRRDLISKYRGKYMAWGVRLDALSTARGCPYRCNFCCVPKIWRGYRQRAPMAVIDEIKQMDPEAEIIQFVDDNFCHNMKRVSSICDLIIQEGLNDRLYSCFARIDSIVGHPDVVQKMAKANIRTVFIGIEGATQLSLDKMKKKAKLEDVRTACQLLEKNGILIWAGHIIGNLDDTYEDVEALIEFSNSLPLDVAQYTVVTPYPGTELHDIAKERNLIDDFNYAKYCECEPMMHTEHLSRIELLELEIKAYSKFYGLWSSMKRFRRLAKNPEKKWILEQNAHSSDEYKNYRRKTTSHFVKEYKELLGKTEGIQLAPSSILLGHKSYSIIAGIVTGLLAILFTASTASLYNDYSSLSKGLIAFDLLLISFITVGTMAFVATLLALKLYYRGYIISFRQRKSSTRSRDLKVQAVKNGFVYGGLVTILMGLICILILTNDSLPFSYETFFWVKTFLLAFLASLISFYVSFNSIDAARTGAIRLKR
ncbi:MAG: B12-binding domain-containing radical SAM protein [Candidatus Hodarchaeota archaeon]